MHRFAYFRLNPGCLCPIIRRNLTFSNGSANHNSNPFPAIASTSNERIKLIRSLQHKKFRDGHNLFFLEGGRVVFDAIKSSSNLNPQTLLLTNNAYESEVGQEIVSLVDTKRTKVCLITDAVFDSLTDTKQGQGIIATLTKPPPLNRISTTTQPAKPLVILLLDRLSDPGNVGTLIRTAYGLGVDCILNVECCDIYSSKVLRSAMGITSLQLPILELKTSDLTACLSGFQKELFQSGSGDDNGNTVSTESGTTMFVDQNTTVAANTEQQRIPSQSQYGLQFILADGNDSITEDGGLASSQNYDKITYTDKHTVIVIGSEAHGISSETRNILNSLCRDKNFDSDKNRNNVSVRKVKIPMCRNLESLNAAVAGSIIMAEVARQQRL